MNLFLLKPPEKDPEIITIPDTVIPSNDLPLILTEGCVAAGCPEDLW